VVVTGAGGRTGGLIIKQLLSDPTRFTSVIGTVRSKAAAKVAGLPEGDVVEVDLAAAAAEAATASDVRSNAAAAGLLEALQGADALVICTSGVPQIKYASLIGVIAGRLIGRKFMPGFTWKQGQTPEQVRSAAGDGVRAHVDDALVLSPRTRRCTCHTPCCAPRRSTGWGSACKSTLPRRRACSRWCWLAAWAARTPTTF
jgi:hypothetical protein